MDWLKENKEIVFAVLAIVIGIAKTYFGFDEWLPSEELQAIIDAIVLLAVGLIGLIAGRKSVK